MYIKVIQYFELSNETFQVIQKALEDLRVLNGDL
jgi:hypothetical protein